MCSSPLGTEACSWRLRMRSRRSRSPWAWRPHWPRWALGAFAMAEWWCNSPRRLLSSCKPSPEEAREISSMNLKVNLKRILKCISKCISNVFNCLKDSSTKSLKLLKNWVSRVAVPPPAVEYPCKSPAPWSQSRLTERRQLRLGASVSDPFVLLRLEALLSKSFRFLK